MQHQILTKEAHLWAQRDFEAERHDHPRCIFVTNVQFVSPRACRLDKTLYPVGSTFHLKFSSSTISWRPLAPIRRIKGIANYVSRLFGLIPPPPPPVHYCQLDSAPTDRLAGLKRRQPKSRPSETSNGHARRLPGAPDKPVGQDVAGCVWPANTRC